MGFMIICFHDVEKEFFFTLAVINIIVMTSLDLIEFTSKFGNSPTGFFKNRLNSCLKPQFSLNYQ